MSVVSLPDIKAYFVKSEQGIKTSKQAFDKLESYLPSLKGRKFYGLVYGKPPDEEYFACLAIEPQDEFKPLPLQAMTIPGGWYAQEKLLDWSNNLHKFSEVFRKMSSENTVDYDRPFIEFYRSFKEVVCRVPITKD